MILVLNSGSSSLKYRLVDPEGTVPGQGGVIARIGEPGEVPDHRAALEQVFAALAQDGLAVSAVGHRIVHGGATFREPTLVDDGVVAVLRDLVPLAPLHNPGGIAGIEAARAALPDLPHVAVFDTAFHTTLPEAASTYAIDRETATRYGIRRYGFHGTSYEFVAARAAALLGRPLRELNLIVLHLGNGASAAAIAGGRSVETSMGMSPLEGLVMGTRCGDLDPAVVFYLHRAAGLDLDAVEDLLTRHSGLAGMCGTNDIRDVLAARAAGDEAARVAFDVYCHRIRKYVGAYHAVLGRVDAIVFTAGVGERTPEVRAAGLDGLRMWGITVDAARNLDGPPTRVISEAGAPVAVCVVATDEERAIADHVQALLAAHAVVDQQGTDSQCSCHQGGRPMNGDSTEVKQALTDAAGAARRAPSVHNTQPWRWVVHADRLEMFAVRDRQLREQDPEGRLLLISCGTALHHAEVALAAGGWQYQVDRPADEPLAVIRLGQPGVAGPDAARRLALTALRHTDRRTVSEKPVSAEVLEDLTTAVREAGARLDVLRRDQVLELAVTVEHAEQAAGSDERLRAELAQWVGGDRPGGTGLPDSVVPAELPLTTVAERDFGQAGDLEAGVGHDSAATYAVLYGDGDEPVDWIRAGEALSALWLTATGHGASVLPFSSPIELPFTRQALRRMLAGVGYPYLALRLGAIDVGSVPPPPTPRLAAQQVIEIAD